MRIVINKSRCNICEDCIFECPKNAITISLKTGRPEINSKRCNKCLRCIDVCNRNAIEVYE